MKNKTLQRVYKMLKPQTKAIIIISILSIIINIGEVIKPYLIKIVMDDYLSSGLWQKGIISIGIIGFIYIAIVLIGNILDFIVTTSTSMMGENVIYSIRNKLYKYIQYTNIPFHDKTPSGTLFVRITSDVEDITTLFKDVITTFVKDIVLIIVFATMMLVLDYRLACLCFLLVPFVIFTSIFITKISNQVQEYSKKVKTKLNIFLAESIYGVKLIKIFNRQKEKEKECEKLCNKFWKSRVPTAFTEGFLVAFMLIFENLGVSIIIWATINHLFGISLEVGVIYIFITYIKQIFEPINRIVENFETIQEALVSVNKIYDILEHKEYLEDFEDGIKLKEIKGKIEFKNVWFAYEGENWILKDVSFTIEPGQSIALVGKTGSGKTTIIKCINQILSPQSGQILLDDINIHTMRTMELAKKIGYVPQMTKNFMGGTVLDAVLMGRRPYIKWKITDYDVTLVLEILKKLEITHLAHKEYESLSGGQKQKVLIARALAQDPDIYLFDEPTSFLDIKNQLEIMNIAKELVHQHHKLVIMVVHDLTMALRYSDYIILLEKGSVISQGAAHEVLNPENIFNVYGVDVNILDGKIEKL